jgi:hypothetical protein
MTESKTVPRKPMSVGVYTGLCTGAMIVGYVVATGISTRMSIVYGDVAAPATLIGFWLGKVVLKNKRRDWIGIVAFPVIIFLTAIFGTALGVASASHSPVGVNYAPLILLTIPFALSCGLFALFSERSLDE